LEVNSNPFFLEKESICSLCLKEGASSMNRRTLISIVLALVAVLAIGEEKGSAVEVGRIYSNPVVGDGTEAAPYTSLLCSQTGVYSCRNAIGSITSGNDRGKPQYNWALVYVELLPGESWAAIDAIADTPNQNTVRLDGALNDTMPNNLRTRLQQIGAASQQELQPYTTYGDVLLYLLQKHNGPLATLANQFPELYGGP